AGFAPFILISLVSGVLVDRWNRKIVIIVADGLQALITFFLMLLFYYEIANLVYVLIVLAIRSVAQGFHSPASQAIIPLMVPKEKLTRVNSFENMFNSSVYLIGPVIGALLVESLGIENIAIILWVDIITFLIAIIPVLLIFIPDITREKRRQPKKSFKSEFKEGIVFIKNQEGLLSLLVTFTVVNIMSTPVFVLLPLLIVDSSLIGGNATTLAIIFAITQGASLIGAYIMTRGQIFANNAKGVAFGQLLIYISIFLVIISLITSDVNILYISAIFGGIASPLANIPSQTIWQSVVPPDLQGRVMSVRAVIAWTMIPVSQLAGGIISDIIGPINLFSITLIIGIVFLIYAWFLTGFPRVEETLGIGDNIIPETQPEASTDLHVN
ncbi:MAG: MFS transporter, partial [Candidatus Heimdallarchaeota archaeon]